MDHERAIEGPARPHKADSNEGEVRTFALDAARALRDDKCTDLVVLDVRGLSPITDFVVVATGTSDRQMVSAMRELTEYGETTGYPAVRTSRDERATWLVADFVHVMVHLFEPNTRAMYDLEMLWGDAPRVDVPPGPGPLAAKRGTPDA